MRSQTLQLPGMQLQLRTLLDTQQYSDVDGEAASLGISSASWPLFGVVWDAGVVLARLMLDHDVEGRRILEVGCGIGVASLVLATRGADVTATDQHPEAASFLAGNVALNHCPPIPFVRTDWADADDARLGVYDLIIGSDLLYERDHVDLLARFMVAHAAPRCEVVLVDGRRGLLGRFKKRLQDLGFGLAQDCALPAGVDPAFRGKVLTFRR